MFCVDFLGDSKAGQQVVRNLCDSKAGQQVVRNLCDSKAGQQVVRNLLESGQTSEGVEAVIDTVHYPAVIDALGGESSSDYFRLHTPHHILNWEELKKV